MTYKITGYQPERLFHFFEEISAIPRGSSNEKGISDYLVEFAKARGLWCHQDELYNVVIKTCQRRRRGQARRHAAGPSGYGL